MARRRESPAPPRHHAPDPPDDLAQRPGLSEGDEVEASRIALHGGDVLAAGSRIAESRLAVACVGRLDLAAATLLDVEIEELGAVEVVARGGRWRNVQADGGRIGALDAGRATWDGVTLRGLRIDDLSLPSAELSDVLIADCVIGTLDPPDAALARVRFEQVRVDEVDTRGLRASDLDLRGLEAGSFTDARGLAGATIGELQARHHAADVARALGMRVRD